MASDRLYEAAFPFADDVLALPVEDIDRAAQWYGAKFGLVEVERRDDPTSSVNLCSNEVISCRQEEPARAARSASPR